MAQPNIFLMFSASGSGVRKPTPTSLVKWSPPIGIRTGMNHHAFVVHDQVGRSRANIDQADAKFALIGLQHRVGAGQRFEDGVVNVNAGAVQRRDHVLRRGRARGDDVDANLELAAHQSGRIAHAALPIEDELLRQQVQGFAVFRHVDAARLIDRRAHIFAADLARTRCPA